MTRKSLGRLLARAVTSWTARAPRLGPDHLRVRERASQPCRTAGGSDEVPRPPLASVGIATLTIRRRRSAPRRSASKRSGGSLRVLDDFRRSSSTRRRPGCTRAAGQGSRRPGGVLRGAVRGQHEPPPVEATSRRPRDVRAVDRCSPRSGSSIPHVRICGTVGRRTTAELRLWPCDGPRGPMARGAGIPEAGAGSLTDACDPRPHARGRAADELRRPLWISYKRRALQLPRAAAELESRASASPELRYEVLLRISLVRPAMLDRLTASSLRDLGRHERRMFLARDRLGVKPLYTSRGGVSRSPQIRALRL